MQRGVALVILVNLFAIIVEKEVDPYPLEYQRRYRPVWEVMDSVCNVIFIIDTSY